MRFGGERNESRKGHENRIRREEDQGGRLVRRPGLGRRFAGAGVGASQYGYALRSDS